MKKPIQEGYNAPPKKIVLPKNVTPNPKDVKNKYKGNFNTSAVHSILKNQLNEIFCQSEKNVGCSLDCSSCKYKIGVYFDCIDNKKFYNFLLEKIFECNESVLDKLRVKE